MKKTKREQNLMIIGFSLDIVIFTLFIVWFVLYLYPSFLKIENKKTEVADTINNLNRLKKDGISFSKFNLERKDISDIKASYLKSLILKIDTNFFEGNLSNTSPKDYLAFIEDKKKALKNNSGIFDERQGKVNTILPLYSNKIALYDKHTLTDFKFVNYIEKIIETFSLTYNNKIGIGELIFLEGSGDSKDNKNDLSSKIFYIPIKLNINGSKSNILNFLHYFEQVGSVNTDIGDIEIYKDNFIKKGNKTVRLEGDNFSKNYNIYFHQLGDIEYIKLKEYIDSSYKTREKGEDFTTFIKRTQSSGNINIEIGLRFYVKGLSDYKIKEYILNFISNYKEFKKDISKELKNKQLLKQRNTITVNYLQKVNSINNYLLDINKKVKEITKKLNTSKNLSSIYNEATDYNKKMETIKTIIIKEKQKLKLKN